MEQRNLEQRCAIKFCVKLGESASVTFEKLKQTYGELFLSRSQEFRWHKSFLEGRKHIEDEHHSGRPSTSKTDANIERVNTVLRSDRRLALRMLSEQLNLN
ncbi:protein GVQW3 [Trichonephila clavipes]|nr:protein GVQW3 [Trichonephila clavipes]